MAFRGCGFSLLALAMLFIVEAPVPSAARFMVYNMSTGGGRKFLESTAAEGLAVDLMQYHHVDSPFAKRNITLEERVQIAVESSKERAQFFQEQIYGTVSSKAVFTSPVYSGQGSYIMQLPIGTPARTFVAIADTGSDLVWVQCSPCRRCFSQRDPVFNPTASSSYGTVQCASNACTALPRNGQSCSSTSTCLYQYGYGDQSTTAGDLASETLSLTTTSGTTTPIANFVFGCGHNNQGTFDGVDGLVGLGKGSLSLVTQIGPQIGNVFSYCLVSFYSAITKTSPLLLGSNGGGALAYTPLLVNNVNPTFYYVNVVGITVGGTPVSYPSGTFAFTSTGGGGLILDSGTTVTQLDARAYNPLVNALASRINYRQVDGSSVGFDLCYYIPGVSNPTFPAVVFQFQGVNLALPADNVFLQIDNQGTFCLAMQGTSGGISIFGSVQQQNYQVAYDRANSRIGFLQRTC